MTSLVEPLLKDFDLGLIPSFLKPYSDNMVKIWCKLLFRSPILGASDIIYLASAPQSELKPMNSEFIQYFKPFPYAFRTTLIQNSTFAKQLWDRIYDSTTYQK